MGRNSFPTDWAPSGTEVEKCGHAMNPVDYVKGLADGAAPPAEPEAVEAPPAKKASTKASGALGKKAGKK